MIIVLIDSQVHVISFMEVTFEITRGTVRILGGNKSNMDDADAEVSTQKQHVYKTLDLYTATITRSPIRAAQTIHIPPITQVPVTDRCLLPHIVLTQHNHAVSVNHWLRLKNCVRETDQDKSFIHRPLFLLLQVSRKIPNHMVLGYATRNLTLLIPVYWPLVAHITESLGWLSSCAPIIL